MLDYTNINNVYHSTSNLMNDSNSLDSVLNYISTSNCIIYYELLNITYSNYTDILLVLIVLELALFV